MTALKHGVGHEDTHRAFHGATGFARAVDIARDRADDLGFQFGNRSTKLGNAGGEGFIRGDRRIEKNRITLGSGHVAIIIKGHGDVADIFGVGIGLRTIGTS